jgi:hypothetical protein
MARITSRSLRLCCLIACPAICPAQQSSAAPEQQLKSAHLQIERLTAPEALTTLVTQRRWDEVLRVALRRLSETPGDRVTSTPLNEVENGNTLTSFGQSLGLTINDINGNFPHNVFTDNGGLNIVDQDPAGEILTLAGRDNVSSGGIAPEPGSVFLVGAVLTGLGIYARRRGSRSGPACQAQFVRRGCRALRCRARRLAGNRARRIDT